jgi:glutamate synthase domain-containing protein 3
VPAPTVSIPDIRDYHLINAELVHRLDEGHAHVRLVGAEGQRLLAAGLAGSWRAVVEVEGHAGPELAAGLDAPGLTLVCRGAAGDGAARGLRAGLVMIGGDVGAAVGYAMDGGAVLVAGASGPRAGLNQAGGDLILLGRVGALAGERQSGGRLFAVGSLLGPHAGRGHRGGALLRLAARDDLATGLEPDDARAALGWLGRAFPWL